MSTTVHTAKSLNLPADTRLIATRPSATREYYEVAVLDGSSIDESLIVWAKTSVGAYQQATRRAAGRPVLNIRNLETGRLVFGAKS